MSFEFEKYKAYRNGGDNSQKLIRDIVRGNHNITEIYKGANLIWKRHPKYYYIYGSAKVGDFYGTVEINANTGTITKNGQVVCGMQAIPQYPENDTEWKNLSPAPFVYYLNDENTTTTIHFPQTYDGRHLIGFIYNGPCIGASNHVGAWFTYTTADGVKHTIGGSGYSTSLTNKWVPCNKVYWYTSSGDERTATWKIRLVLVYQ